MGIDAAIEYADRVLYERTGKHLSDLQSCIIQQSWQGCTYGQVANQAGYSEGHVKDVASQLWRQLSEALGERITKGNLRSRLLSRLKRTVKSTVKSATPASLHPFMSSSAALVSAAIAPNATAPHAAHLLPYSVSFVGRETALSALQQRLQTYRMVVIQGEGGIGKTTLAQQYCQRFDGVLELLMAKESGNITPVESVVEEWLRQVFDEEPGCEFGVTLARLKRHLEKVVAQTHAVSPKATEAIALPPIAVLIDNIEPALDSNGQFIQGHRRYIELLRVLAASGVPVIMTSRDRLCEPSLSLHHYRLPGLNESAWQQFFETHPVQIDERSLYQMHRAYGGNAKAMEILCAAVIEDFEGDLQTYWHETGVDLLATTDLRNLVASQVNRLQQLDDSAYQVFCRLGCYRYQEQATLPATAIEALMWDIDTQKRRKVLNSLRDRSLLEFRKGRYWLHPVSRAEAIGRLRKSKDWQQANRAAAQYWSDRIESVVSVEDGLEALEAYYHLVAIEDYQAAANVLLKSRHNRWRQFLPLASSLYRMGLLRPVTNAITQVLPRLDAGEFRGASELNNILGDVYWISGKIHSAIACQQKTLSETASHLSSLAIASARSNSDKENGLGVEQSSLLQQLLRKHPLTKDAYYLQMLTVDAHLSIGLYFVDLWALSSAAEQFDQVIDLAAGGAHQAWADKATVGLALVRAYQKQPSVAFELANSVCEQLTIGPADETDRYAYFLQLLGQVFSQLGELDRAQQLYERAVASAEKGHYVQVKAKALTGMAVLQRQRSHYQSAITLHTQAVELCEKIGAQCDLAEAHFQLGLTQLGTTQPAIETATDRNGLARTHMEKAIALFTTIQAPRQVDRVRAANI